MWQKKRRERIQAFVATLDSDEELQRLRDDAEIAESMWLQYDGVESDPILVDCAETGGAVQVARCELTGVPLFADDDLITDESCEATILRAALPLPSLPVIEVEVVDDEVPV